MGNAVHKSDRLKAFWAGVRGVIPLLIGVFPFGMIYGILALDAGLSPGAAQAMSSIVFAGSSQFIAAQLVSNGAPGLVIVFTIAVVNLRHALYSASVAPFTRGLGSLWKGLMAYLLTDEAYAVGIVNYHHTNNPQEEGVHPAHWFYAGAGLGLWSTWQVSTAVGIFLGAAVPASWPLDFTLPLTFIAILTPSLKDRPSTAAAVCAGGAALLGAGLPYKLGLILAALVGILVGMLLEGRK
jgi:4-azaleucine resistance transporter AzlC